MTSISRPSVQLLAVVGVLSFAVSGLAACAASDSRTVIISQPPLRLATLNPSPEATVSAAVLPICVVGDENTRYGQDEQWRQTLLDTNLKLPRSYQPTDLVAVSQAGAHGDGLVREIVIDDLRALSAAAQKAGKPIDVRSAYRSYQYQKTTFDGWARRVGRDEAVRVSARPGHSEHQLGTTLDFGSLGSTRDPWTFDDWGTTPSGGWLLKNAWKYGFVLSYPKGEESETCYSYEPWHYRYVGTELARNIRESEQVPRRYLWENFEAAP